MVARSLGLDGALTGHLLDPSELSFHEVQVHMTLLSGRLNFRSPFLAVIQGSRLLGYWLFKKFDRVSLCNLGWPQFLRSYLSLLGPIIHELTVFLISPIYAILFFNLYSESILKIY